MPVMADSDRREHERIDIEMPTRLWLDESHKGRPIYFEGHATTRDLSVGGTYLRSDYLLPMGFPINLEMQIEEGDVLAARGEVAHRIDPSESSEPGMGVIFTSIDAINRERLLRFFVSDRVRDFYENRFVVEFPHLGSTMSLKDVALVINLWEDKEGRIESLHKNVSEQVTAARREDEVRATKRRSSRKS